MNRPKKSFLPHHFTNEDLSISLGSELTINDMFSQDFYHTGEYFLICPRDDPDCDIPIYVIYFDKEESCLQYKVLRIKVPECKNYDEGKTEFDPVKGKVVHTIERLSKEPVNQIQDLTCDIYYFDIAEILDFIPQKFKVDEVIIKAKSKSFALNWNYQEFNDVEYEFDFRDNNTKGLIFKAFFRHNGCRFEPRCRFDILRFGTQNQIFHSKSVNLELTKSQILLQAWRRTHIEWAHLFLFRY